MSIAKSGRIDKYGWLYIQRGSEEKLMDCYRNEGYCNHACALFGEPYDLSKNGILQAGLSICHNFWEFETFTDERN